jgi:spore coat protein JB
VIFKTYFWFYDNRHIHHFVIIIQYDEGGYVMYNYTNCNQDNYSMNEMNNYMPSNMYQSSNQSLFNSYDGFIRGNMFAELYKPWMMGEPFNLTPTSEREALLNKVREYGFALVDLDLYLDVHESDAEMIKAYNQYLELEKNAKEEFESKYGPLSLTSETLNSYPWAWAIEPWPWEAR